MKMNNLFKETIFELFSFIKKFKFISIKKYKKYNI